MGSPILGILQSLFGGGLTRDNSALQAPGGEVTLGSPESTMAGANQALNAAGPSTGFDVQDGAPVLTPNPAQATLPKIFKPSFAQTSTDKAGNTMKINASQTKGGKLLAILRGGLQGGLDAMASGALDAVPGRSSFGAGVQGAMQLPIFRQQQQQARQRQGLEDQVLQGQIQSLPFLRQKQQADLANTQAQTDWHKAQANTANQPPVEKPTVENLDQLIAGAAQKAIQEGRAPDEDPTVTQLSAVKSGLAKQAATNRDDKAIAIMGKPSAEWTPEEKQYMKGYDSYVQKTKVLPGEARARIFVEGRAVQVEDPSTGVKSYQPAGEAMQQGSIAGSTNLQKNAFTPAARIKDVERVSTAIEGNVDALDQDNAQKALIAHSLTDPTLTTAGQFIKSKIASNLSPKSREYVVSVLSMREQIMGLNQLLTGTSGTSDARIKAIWDTLPNGSEPDADMAKRKMKLVRGMIGNVREAFPMMKVIPGQGESNANVKTVNGIPYMQQGDGTWKRQKK